MYPKSGTVFFFLSIIANKDVNNTLSLLLLQRYNISSTLAKLHVKNFTNIKKWASIRTDTHLSFDVFLSV